MIEKPNEKDAQDAFFRFDEIETKKGQILFEECRKSVFRFIKSHLYSPEEAEDLTQEVCVRVLKKLDADRSFAANCGYFINFAKFVYIENNRKFLDSQNKFVSIENDAKTEKPQPIDAQVQTENFTTEKNRSWSNDCYLECFEQLKIEDQVLLWRYSFIESEHHLSGEDETNQKFFGTLFDSLRDTFEKFLPIQNSNQPLSLAEKKQKRLRVHRKREILKQCLKDCFQKNLNRL